MPSLAPTPVSCSIITSCALCAPWWGNPELELGSVGCCECPQLELEVWDSATHGHTVPCGGNCPTAEFGNAGLLHLFLVCFHTASVVCASVFPKPLEFPLGFAP